MFDLLALAAGSQMAEGVHALDSKPEIGKNWAKGTDSLECQNRKRNQKVY